MDEKVELTTQLTLNKDELDAIVIAISDSKEKCVDILTLKKEQLEDVSTHELLERMQKTAKSLLSTYANILGEINDIYPEIEDREDKQKGIILP